MRGGSVVWRPSRSWKVVPSRSHADVLRFLQEQASFGSIKSVQRSWEAPAGRELGSVTKENLKVTRARNAVTVEAHYTITIEFFGGAYKYVWKFDQVVERPTFAV